MSYTEIAALRCTFSISLVVRKISIML